MSRIQQSCPMSALAFIVMTLLAILSSLALADDNPVQMPENSHTKSYGRGWECNHGYKKNNNTCIQIKIPDNAYLSAYGDRWECNRGYRVSGQGCVAIKVPVHGYLVESTYGPGWKCERGFREAGEECIAVKVPDNAHIDMIGNDWECNKPYHPVMYRCVLD